jgi:hypothetical protein
MAKAVSPTPRKDPAARSLTASDKPRSRSVKSSTAQVEAPPTAELITTLTERLNAVEEKITTGFSSLAAAVQTLQATPALQRPEGNDQTETILPIVADLIRRNLIEHLTPVTAALKRLEERVGVVSTRLKHSPGGGGQERQKPWRHDQSPHSRPRRQNGPRPGQGQQWSPPSAASVQGHFAPRPFRGGDESPTGGEEEE